MSFETPGWNIPPPAASVDSNPLPSSLPSSNNKRKRPTAGSEDKAASVGVNLEKLMAQMEKEEKATTEGGPVGKKAKEREVAKKGKQEANAKKFEGKPPPAPPVGKPQQKGGKKEGAGQKGKQTKPTTPSHNPPASVLNSAPEVTTSASEPPQKKTKLTKAEKKRALQAAVDAAGGADAVALPSPPPTIALPTTVPSATTSATSTVTSSIAPPPPAPIPAEAKGKKAGKKEKKKQAQEAKKPVVAQDDVVMSEEGGEVRNAVEVPMEEDLPVSREPGLTPMQAKMKGRLEGARFRWINEQLYTTSSEAALEMMKADPSVFSDYHQGFRHQASSWPSSPVTLLTSRITSLLPTSSSSSPLIIDLGAGDAQLAKDLAPLGYNVLSYDLIGDYDGEGWVAEADYCQRIPLPGASSGGGGRFVDGAVCCLSLMGRNWIGGVREIARVLKEGGVYEIAEITSRMPSVDAFIEMVSSLGFKLTRKDDSNTHFLLFSFVRQGKPTWDQGGSVDWEDVLKKGEEVLKACVYKKR